MTMTTAVLTFEKLAELEPLLRVIEADVKAAAAELRRKRTRCANGCWYGYGKDARGFKEWMSTLVGAYRHGRRGETPERRELLSSSATYDTVYQHLYELLPDCRNCGCL